MPTVIAICALPFCVITFDKKDCAAFQTQDNRLDSRMLNTVHWIISDKYLVDNRKFPASKLFQIQPKEYNQFVSKIGFAKQNRVFRNYLLNTIDSKYSYFTANDKLYGVDYDLFNKFVRIRDGIDAKMEGLAEFSKSDLRHFAIVEGVFNRLNKVTLNRSIGSVIQVAEVDDRFVVLYLKY